MNRLFQTLRGFVERPRPIEEMEANVEALPGFENRIEVLSKYAERASAYEETLQNQYDQISDQMMQLQGLMEQALDAGEDRDALEYLRLAARLRPQRALLESELKAFHALAGALIWRVVMLLDNVEEARAYASSTAYSPAATRALDQALNRLTRYFVLLERVTIARHNQLPMRLAEQMMQIVDDRQLDLELARFILSRRRALGGGTR